MVVYIIRAYNWRNCEQVVSLPPQGRDDAFLSWAIHFVSYISTNRSDSSKIWLSLFTVIIVFHSHKIEFNILIRVVDSLIDNHIELMYTDIVTQINFPIILQLDPSQNDIKSDIIHYVRRQLILTMKYTFLT